MTEKQPVLGKFYKLSEDDGENNDRPNTEQIATSSLADWRLCFNGPSVQRNCEEVTESPADRQSKATVGVFQLFRFANRVDLLLMFVSGCLLFVHNCCGLANLVIFGRLAGLFSIKSFNSTCHDQSSNAAVLVTSNYSCLSTVHSNHSIHVPVHGPCYHTLPHLLTTPSSTVHSFRPDVMALVYWLLIIGPIEVAAAASYFFLWSFAIRRQTSRMSIRLFESVIQRKISYLDVNGTSHLNTKLFDNISKIEEGINCNFLGLPSLLFLIVVALVISLIISWPMTLIMFGMAPFLILGSILFSKFVARSKKHELNAYSKAGQIAGEVFSSLRTVLSLNGSKFEQRRYEKELHAARESSVREGAVFGVYMGWLAFLSYFIYSIGFTFGSFLMSYDSHNRLTISDLLVVVCLLAQILRQFTFVGYGIQALLEARTVAAPIFQYIDETQDVKINDAKTWRNTISESEVIDIKGDIEFNNVGFAYPSRQDVSVLNSLSLVARAGQTTALVGSSGCGKSTCISLLLRFYEPTSGQIMVKGRPLEDYNLSQLRQNIGVISQEPVLFGTSIYENIRFGKTDATRAEIEEAARQANAHRFIMRLPKRYDTLVGERGIQLSGGEKQRIALARALVKQPTILLLDEATSALDNANERIVQEALDRACQGRTTVVIAHRLNTIRNAHYTYVLNNGHVIEEGTHEALMANEEGKYQAMFKSQRVDRLSEHVQNGSLDVNEAMEEEAKQILNSPYLLDHGQSVDKDSPSASASKRRFSLVKLFAMNKSEWATITIGCVACVLGGASQPVFAILFSKIISSFRSCAPAERNRDVLISSFLFLLLGLAHLVVRFFKYTAFAISGSKLTQRIRSKTFACLLRQEVAYFDRPENHSGAICARLSSQASAVEQAMGVKLGSIVESMALTVCGLVFSILFSWQLALVVFIPFCIYFVLSWLTVHFGQWYRRHSSLILEQASSLAVEVVHNLRTLKQLSAEEEVVQQYSKSINQVSKLSRTFFFLSSITYSIFWGLDIYVPAFIYWCGLILIEEGQIQSSDVTSILAFVIFTVQTLKTIGFLATQIGTSTSAADDFFNLFDRIPAIDNASNKGHRLADFRGQIQFDQVTFVYPLRPTSTALNKFQLDISPGQCVALVGASGCGKSTVIQLLERFYDVTHGQLLLDGMDIRALDLQWVRSRFGLVSQEPVLFDLTIAENIAYGLHNVPMEDIINAATKANIHQFIIQLPEAYATRVGVKGCFLSGGEKQRIAIARAFLRRPKVLVLDEATSAMDSYNEQIVQQTLEEARMEDPSRTTLIIAHRLSTIRSCDLICVIDGGHIIESGTHSELMQRRGAYYNMVA